MLQRWRRDFLLDPTGCFLLFEKDLILQLLQLSGVPSE